MSYKVLYSWLIYTITTLIQIEKRPVKNENGSAYALTGKVYFYGKICYQNCLNPF